MSRSDTLQLYKQLIKTQRVLPSQEDRAKRLSVYALSAIRSRFRQPLTAPPSAALAHGHAELASLQRIATGAVLVKYPLAPASTLLSFLPPRSAYQLLNVSAQDALSSEKVSTMTFFPTYVWGNLKRMVR